MLEMISRVVKNKIRFLLRKNIKLTQTFKHQSLKETTINILNLILGESSAAESTWCEIELELEKRFFVAHQNHDKSINFKQLVINSETQTLLGIDNRCLLFARIGFFWQD